MCVCNCLPPHIDPVIDWWPVPAGIGSSSPATLDNVYWQWVDGWIDNLRQILFRNLSVQKWRQWPNQSKAEEKSTFFFIFNFITRHTIPKRNLSFSARCLCLHNVPLRINHYSTIYVGVGVSNWTIVSHLFITAWHNVDTACRPLWLTPAGKGESNASICHNPSKGTNCL